MKDWSPSATNIFRHAAISRRQCVLRLSSWRRRWSMCSRMRRRPVARQRPETGRDVKSLASAADAAGAGASTPRRPTSVRSGRCSSPRSTGRAAAFRRALDGLTLAVVAHGELRSGFDGARLSPRRSPDPLDQAIKDRVGGNDSEVRRRNAVPARNRSNGSRCGQSSRPAVEQSAGSSARAVPRCPCSSSISRPTCGAISGHFPKRTFRANSKTLIALTTMELAVTICSRARSEIRPGRRSGSTPIRGFEQQSGQAAAFPGGAAAVGLDARSSAELVLTLWPKLLNAGDGAPSTTVGRLRGVGRGRPRPQAGVRRLMFVDKH